MLLRRHSRLLGLAAAALAAVGVVGYFYLKNTTPVQQEKGTVTEPIAEAADDPAPATPEAKPATEGPSPATTARSSEEAVNAEESSRESSPDCENGLVRPHSVVILFGTQSGTSEHVAMDIRQHLQVTHKFVEVVVADIEYYRHYPPTSGSFFVFVIATYGDGEPSESAEQFWREMKSKALNESGIWQGVPVTVVGLGNRAYRNFCGFAVKLNKKLKTIRAHRICTPLKVNDQEDVDTQLETWLANQFDPAVRELCQRPPSATLPLAPPPPTIPVAETFVLHPPDVAPRTFGAVHPCSSVVKPIFASTRGNFQIVSCRSRGAPSLSERKMYYVEVEAMEPDKVDPTTLYAGSTFGWFPQQAPADSLFLLGLFEHRGIPLVSLQQHKFEFKSEAAPVPNGTTVEELVTALSNFSVTPTCKWLRSYLLPHLPVAHPARSVFSEGPEGDVRFQTLVKAPPLTLREVLSYVYSLEQFRLPLTFLLEHVSRVAPRQYTVASAVDRGRFTLLVAETFTHRAHKPRLTGLCSAMLNRLAAPPHQQLPIRIRGTACTAIFGVDTWQRGGVWIVNGSGVSAAMAFLDQRRRLWAPRDAPETLLFYGVRTSDPKDFAAEKLIRAAVMNGWLAGAFFAFSRNPSGQQAGYLDPATGDLLFMPHPAADNARQDQHFYIHALVGARREDVRRVVTGSASSTICICGSQAMKGTVWGALVGVFEQEGIEFLSNLIAEQRVLTECW